MADRPSEIVPRRIEGLLRARLDEEPVIVLNGPRTVGKSTLLRRLAASMGAQVIDLDDLATRQAVETDPTLFTAGASPVLIDEFQFVPDLLSAIKAELNVDLRPGRFVLTGPTRYATLPRAAQSLTGRVHVMTVWPLSQCELERRDENVLDVLLDDPQALVTAMPSATTRADYEAKVLRGGLPIALSRGTDARRRWFADYVRLVIERDVLDIRQIRQAEMLPRLLRRLAAQTAGVLNVTKAARESHLDNSSAEDYVRLLEQVFLVHRLPAWGQALGARTAKLPKVHVVDSGLGGWLLGLTTEALASRDPAKLTEFGHLVETFAVNELLKQASWLDGDLLAGHFRTRDGDEVDLVLETFDGQVVAVEVKAAGTVGARDLTALRMLRDKLGRRFVGGVALYLGPRAYTAEDKIHVLPLDRLWSG